MMHGVTDETLVGPESYTLDSALLARPGNDEIQLDLFLDYASNVALYPKFQEYFRAKRPPLLAFSQRRPPSSGSIVSVQVGGMTPLGPEDVPSGFVKQPVDEPVMAGRFGLAGEQAGRPARAWWARQIRLLRGARWCLSMRRCLCRAALVRICGGLQDRRVSRSAAPLEKNASMISEEMQTASQAREPT